jgi:vacuolar-type H+-ATPase subunit H
MARSRANNKLKAARNHAKEGALQEAEQELRNAYKGFLDLKGLL